jgi:hypothetical protein
VKLDISIPRPKDKLNKSQTISFFMLTEKEIIKFVKPFYAQKDPMHGFPHILRIKRKVSFLKKQYKKVDKDMLNFLIYFHGIKKWVKENENKLLSMDFKKEQIKSLTRAEDTPTTIEEKIVCDANMLENVGKFGIKKALILAKHYNQTQEETLLLQKEFMPKYKFFTPLGKKLGALGIKIKKKWLKEEMNKLNL